MAITQVDTEGHVVEMLQLPVFILAGGRSTRFGSNKARALLRERPLLTHVASSLASVTARLTVVAQQVGDYADLGLRTIADEQPGLGPLGGLAAATTDLGADEPLALLVACDQLGLQPRWVVTLAAAARGQPQALALAFRGTRWEPLPLLFRKALRPRIDELLAQGRRSLQALLDGEATGLALPDDWALAHNVNTVAELGRLT